MIGYELLKNIDTIKFFYKNELIGTPFNLNQLISYYGKNIIPIKKGIYMLFYKDCIVYVGMSKNIKTRLLGHLRDTEMIFEHCIWFCMEDSSIEQILTIEKNMIKKFKPSLNSFHLDYFK